MKEQKPLTIGKLAKVAGVHVETVRYYQRIGLLPLPPKRGGIRRYCSDYVEKIRFIKKAQRLGFSLKQIKTLLETDPNDCAAIARQAATLKARIEREIEQLEALRQHLEALLKACHQGQTPCPIYQTLKAP